MVLTRCAKYRTNVRFCQGLEEIFREKSRASFCYTTLKINSSLISQSRRAAVGSYADFSAMIAWQR